LYYPQTGFNTSFLSGTPLLRSWTLAGVCNSNADPGNAISVNEFARKLTPTTGTGGTRNVLWTHFGLDTQFPVESPSGGKFTMVANDIYVHDSNALHGTNATGLTYDVGYKYKNFDDDDNTSSSYNWNSNAVTGTGSQQYEVLNLSAISGSDPPPTGKTFKRWTIFKISHGN